MNVSRMQAALADWSAEALGRAFHNYRAAGVPQTKITAIHGT